MAKFWWALVGVSTALAAACGAGEGAFERAEKTPGERISPPAARNAPAAIALDDKRAAPAELGCKLLDDPTTRARLGGALENKLLLRCGRAGRSPQAVRPSPEAPARSELLLAAPGSDILVNDPTLDTGGSTQSETSIVAVGDVICAAWNDAGEGFGLNGFAGFGYSLDGGQTFHDGGPFPAGPGGDMSFGDPSLAFSVRDNAFYYASLSIEGLSLWRSTDSCQSFEYVGVIHSSFDDKELMAVDNTPTSPYFGRIHVGWTDFGRPNDVNVATYSDDGGLTWSPAVAFPGSGTSGQGVYPAVAPNGDVYMAFVIRDFSIGGHQHQWIYRSTDGGSSWAKAADIGTSQLQPENQQDSSDCGRQALSGHIRNLSSPQIVVTADASASVGYVIHSVYPYDSDGAGPDHSNVFYRRSVDGAASWSPEVMLNDDGTSTDQFYPAIGASEDGLLAASWYDRRLDTANLLFDRYVTISTDGGLSWSENERLSDVSSPVAQTLPNFDGLATCYHGDYDQVALSGNVAHIVWSDDRRITGSGPNPDVYFDQHIVNPHLGRLTSTQPAVSCSGSLGFTLTDVDLAGAGSHTIDLETTTGDAEVLVLSEDASKPGRFSGSITSAAGGVTPSSGVLELVDGAVITATYEDADDGSGNPATVVLDLPADCAPPSLSNVRVTALTGTSATIAADTSEPSALTAEYGFDCGALEQSTTSTLSGTPSVSLESLYAGFTYYYALTATDAYGNSVRDDNGGSCYSFKTLDVIFLQDFESGLGGFEIADSDGSGGTGSGGEGSGGTGGTGSGGISGASGSGGRAAGGRAAGGTTSGGSGGFGGEAEAGSPGSGGAAGDGSSGGLWHLSQTCASASGGHSKPTTLYYGLDATCDFDAGATRGAATSPPIVLDDATFATVEFNYYLGTEGGGFYDRAALEVSVNDGPFQIVTSNFTSLVRLDLPRKPKVRTRQGAAPAGRYALLENSGKWQRSVSDLTPYLAGLASATIRLRFSFDSVDSALNAFPGFYVDDVQVLGVSAPVPCTADAECDDGRFCTGTESCVAGFCAKGLPVVCSGDDGVACTAFLCSEETHSCVQVPNDYACDDGVFCNGEERCDATAGCVSGMPVACAGGGVACVVGECNESAKRCIQFADDSKCDDGAFCTGREYCDPSNGCQSSEPPCVDGVACTDDVCDEDNLACAFPPNHARCDDGLFCDGAEYCDPYQGCMSPGPACGPGDRCDEGGEQCIPICFTDTNSNHKTAGRAYIKRNSYFALGSNDTLGKAAAVTSLQGGGSYWNEVPSCPAPPTVDSVSVSVKGDQVIVSGQTSDPNGDILEVRLTFYVYLYFPTTLDATGTTSFTGSLGLPPGVHGVTVQAVDRAGFVSAPTEVFYFEILQPAPPTIDSIAVTVSGNKVTVAGTASDPNDDITKVQITILKDGVLVASAVATGTNTWTGTVSGLAVGTYAARAQAFDSYGFATVLTEPIPFTITPTIKCFTATNSKHRNQARAERVGGVFYALGSHDNLGPGASTVTSLRGSGSDWHEVSNCP